MIRTLVVDDHEVVRAGFAALLGTQPDIDVVGTASDGADAVRQCQHTAVDVVLMDVRMPVLDGIEATRQILGGTAPLPRVLVMTTFDLDVHVYDALNAGASGFVLKDLTAEQLFEAVRVIAAGDALLAPTVTRRLITAFVRQGATLAGPRDDGSSRSGDRATFGALTPREHEVLHLVALGLSNAEISDRLTVTDETVKTHVSRVLAKLGVRDRVQAVVLAYEAGIVVPSHRQAPEPPA
ncbi:response regulator transcription factor [Knoellia sp. S7-12]|uniref:response regulator transcription factor n=1 Tax=Knoellia sp. S7-12 TaxID=3126698 RepID=UPI00336671C2